MPDYLDDGDYDHDAESDPFDEGPSAEDIARFGGESQTCEECGAGIYDGVSMCPRCGAFQLDAIENRRSPERSPGYWLFRVAIGLVILSFLIWLIMV